MDRVKFKELVDSLKIQAENGDVGAMKWLGDAYYQGISGDEQNVDAAISYWKMAADNGEISVAGKVGIYLVNNGSNQQEKSKGIPYLTRAAENGQTEYQFLLGFCYENGIGVTKNYDKAEQYYLPAAHSNHVKAQGRLAFICAEKNDADGMYYWLTCAVLNGDAEMKQHYDHMYNSGSESFRDEMDQIADHIKRNGIRALANKALNYAPKEDAIIIPDFNVDEIYNAYVLESKSVNQISKDIEIGDVYTGKITRILPIGAFMELPGGKEGLIHISKIAHERVDCVEDYFKVGELTMAKVVDIKQGKYDLSRKALLPEHEEINQYIPVIDDENELATTNSQNTDEDVNWTEAFNNLKFIADTGDALASAMVGKLLVEKAIDIETDSDDWIDMDVGSNDPETLYAQAIPYLTKAANTPNENRLIAQEYLGWCYYKARGVKQNSVMAEEYAKPAALNNAENAQRIMAYICEEKKDTENKIFWMICAMLNGNEEMKAKFEQEYECADSIQKEKINLVLANVNELGTELACFKKGADEGDLNMCVIVGRHYIEKGFEIDQNNPDGDEIPEEAHIYYRQAIPYLTKAADEPNEGQEDAQVNLGMCYHWGLGIKNDKLMAEKYFRYAALKNNAFAQSMMCELSSEKRDADGMYHWMICAMLNGDSDRKHQYEEIWNSSSESLRNKLSHRVELIKKYGSDPDIIGKYITNDTNNKIASERKQQTDSNFEDVVSFVEKTFKKESTSKSKSLPFEQVKIMDSNVECIRDALAGGIIGAVFSVMVFAVSFLRSVLGFAGGLFFGKSNFEPMTGAEFTSMTIGFVVLGALLGLVYGLYSTRESVIRKRIASWLKTYNKDTAPIIDNSNVKKKVNVDKIKKRIPMIILAAMLLLVTSSGVDILRAYKSPEQSIGRAINDGDYTEVMSIIESGSLALDSSEVVNLFIEKVTELSSGFESGVIDYWGAIEELKTIQNMNLESIAKDVENAVFYVENLNNSRMSYDQAESFYNAGNLLDALQGYVCVIEEDENYEDAQSKIDSIKENMIAQINEDSSNGMVGDAVDKLTVLTEYFDDEVQTGIENYDELMAKKNFNDKISNTSHDIHISAGDDHTVGLRADGTVVAAGDNNYGQCNVGNWKDIVSVAGGEDHSVGLTSTGTAVAVGRNNYGQCNVSNLDGITAVSAGYDHTVLLKEDGTVVAVGDNSKGQCNVSSWSNIVAVCAGNYHTVGLRADGTVVLAGNSYDVSSWNDIVDIAAGLDYTIGLKSDGTVVAKGENDSGQCNVGSWSDIIKISAGEDHTVGLMSNGSVVAVGYNTYNQCNVSSWENVLHITAGEDHTVGIMEDGTVVSLGYNGFGQCDTSSWSSMRTN